ncbi:hypothetical protein MJO28_011362 [Puccinia striiformis f. sp. tritici]|uniref:Uncharacterized protein n=1 Tax=Puccinia striiformis f. sp. tritici TaxID=168172 RepID=A0ACC0E3W7_9BASI|nr:hypothetical protein Pst134EB_021832 [Puccinia striiformis f. sp. tritici]KAI7943834.1 hypothetical protein MJO28_011362 [Puccinia striiformis f. sp. tritici]KAI9612655.1 hypothetical protein H4Q26_007812 [Puccinia striiformis f. sp. tritici PST-130]
MNNMGLWGSPWINNWANSLGGCYGAAIFQPSFGLNSMYFAKATDEAQSVSRRAIHLNAEQLFRRADDSVTCLSEKGIPEVFSAADCAKAAKTLHEKNVSTAQSGTCKLSLVSSKEKVVAKQVSGQTLQKAASSILSTCGTKASQSQSNKPAQVNGKQVAMLLSKA